MRSSLACAHALALWIGSLLLGGCEVVPPPGVPPNVAYGDTDGLDASANTSGQGMRPTPRVRQPGPGHDDQQDGGTIDQTTDTGIGCAHVTCMPGFECCIFDGRCNPVSCFDCCS